MRSLALALLLWVIGMTCELSTGWYVVIYLLAAAFYFYATYVWDKTLERLEKLEKQVKKPTNPFEEEFK